RRAVILEKINAMPGLSCLSPQGAFYVFIDIGKFGIPSLEFCDRLLSTHHVAMIPGVAFDADTYIRMSYAASLETIETGLDRLNTFISKL
ncbi:MAG: aminotransferase class I/II-fold pyridoxal phosphate-dependent enzyme, partial [Leptolyngbyaceae bacterium]|nr:aminotransferase class I/II-fold pyridoxal phosphate-dependent enzyme [Leptolyngbyaceae bacterium]